MSENMIESHEQAKQQLDEFHKDEIERWESFVDELDTTIDGKEISKWARSIIKKYEYDLDAAMYALREIIESYGEKNNE